jgi:hypothetical protein
MHIYLVEFWVCPIDSGMMNMAYLSIGPKKISNNINEHFYTILHETHVSIKHTN